MDDDRQKRIDRAITELESNLKIQDDTLNSFRTRAAGMIAFNGLILSIFFRWLLDNDIPEGGTRCLLFFILAIAAYSLITALLVLLPSVSWQGNINAEKILAFNSDSESLSEWIYTNRNKAFKINRETLERLSTKLKHSIIFATLHLTAWMLFVLVLKFS